MEFKECKCSLDMVTLNVKQFVHSSYNPTTKFKVIGVSDTMEILVIIIGVEKSVLFILVWSIILSVGLLVKMQ